MTGTENEDVVFHQLTVILVGREHIGLYASRSSLRRQRADDVVGLVAIHLENGDVVGLEDVLDDGHTRADILGSLLALRLVFRESLVAERRSVRVESHTDMRWFLLFKHLVERVAKAHNGRGVQAL